jgi:hypothetical protein
MARTKKARPAKKVTKQKKTVKRIKKQKAQPKAVETALQALVTLTPEQLYQPELETGKYALVPSPLKTVQIESMLEKTPTQFIKSRKGKGGKNFSYVTGHYMHAKLDFVTGRMYDFEILSQQILGEFVVTLGKLTLKDPRTKMPVVTRMQNGTKAIAFMKDKPHTAENYVDIGNDFKASATDAFKKCCADLGIARDVYASNENFEEGFEDTPKQPVATTPEQLQEIITRAINNAKDTATLFDIDEKLQATDKLPKNIKQALHTAISNRIDVLTVESGK